MQGTIQIVIPTTRDIVDELSDTLMSLGALAISFTDAKDEPIFQLSPEDEPLWEETILKALFPRETSIETLLRDITAASANFKDLDITIESVEEKNWVEETQNNFHHSSSEDYGSALNGKKPNLKHLPINQLFTLHRALRSALAHIQPPNSV